MKKKLYGFLSLLVALSVLLSLSSCTQDGCPHVFEDACDDDCEICDYERIVSHVWDEGDCYTARYCINCAETDGEPHGHNVHFGRGVDEEPKLCDRCHFFVYPDNHTEPYHE